MLMARVWQLLSRMVLLGHVLTLHTQLYFPSNPSFLICKRAWCCSPSHLSFFLSFFFLTQPFKVRENYPSLLDKLKNALECTFKCLSEPSFYAWNSLCQPRHIIIFWNKLFWIFFFFYHSQFFFNFKFIQNLSWIFLKNYLLLFQKLVVILIGKIKYWKTIFSWIQLFFFFTKKIFFF